MKSRGLRNNNPGNIRQSHTAYLGEIPGDDASFKKFRTMAYGYRAMFVTLRTYYRAYHLRTIRQLVSRWAPSQDGNHTELYIRYVAVHSHVGGADTFLQWNENTMIPVVASMSQMENGEMPLISDIKGGWDLLDERKDWT